MKKFNQTIAKSVSQLQSNVPKNTTQSLFVVSNAPSKMNYSSRPSFQRFNLTKNNFASQTLYNNLKSSQSFIYSKQNIKNSIYSSKPISRNKYDLPQTFSKQSKLLSEELKQKLFSMRNIGISAHIDSGKTTTTERILFYTGRINEVHEVRGKDGVGAKMDSMELEREKGITIQSAATFCKWKDKHINIIDTPGHVDFTIEVERALRVLDGGVLIICAASGVQSQSLTVDRQMKRYGVPRVCFINKCDRMGADPNSCLQQVREKLGLNAAFVQMPIGLEDKLSGVIDLIDRKAYKFEGSGGKTITDTEIPARLQEEVEEKRKKLCENLADVDDELGDIYLNDEEPSTDQIRDAIRRQTIQNKFVPVFVGSAMKNVGVQLLLDGICSFLPSPYDIDNYALDISSGEQKILTVVDENKPFVGLAFKLEEGKYGQLTYVRVYQGKLKKGDSVLNTRTQKKVKIPRIVRTHSNELEDVDEIGPGEICALFGVECASGDTFCANVKKNNLGMESIFVPDAVVSLSVQPKDKAKEPTFAKALSRFIREDPTFRVVVDEESGQTIISGMGELHLDIYIERMRREYECDVITGKPYVAYRESITRRAQFDYLHKKQSGGAGQYAKVVGYIEPIEDSDLEGDKKWDFKNHIIGNAITPNYVSACEKGFGECMTKGPLLNCPVWNVRVVLTDGATHVVDSSELAFRIACQYAFKQAFEEGNPKIMEPIMKVEVNAPSEYQASVAGSLSRRKGIITNTTTSNVSVCLISEVPLREMFGYASDLRSLTAGKGEFAMEYSHHQPAASGVLEELLREREQEKSKK